MAFADLHAHVADPAHMRTTAGAAARPRLPASARQGHRPEPRRLASRRAAAIAAARSTSARRDAAGRMVSFIQSNYKGFGSGVVVPGTGIALHNRGFGFVTTPGHPNEVAGGKRPLHSIIPAFMTQGGRPAMAFGVMGGNMQAQGHMQMVLRRVVEGLDPQACVDAPRWRIDDAGALTVEPTRAVVGDRGPGGDGPSAARRAARTTSTSAARRSPFGSDADLVGNDDPVYAAGSDHRRDGQAVGW